MASRKSSANGRSLIQLPGSKKINKEIKISKKKHTNKTRRGVFFLFFLALPLFGRQMAPSASWSIAEATRNWFDQHQLIKTEKEEEEDDDHHEPQLPKSSPNAELYGEIAKKRGKNETFSKWKIKLQNPVIPESSVLISVIILVGHFSAPRYVRKSHFSYIKPYVKMIQNWHFWG